MTSPDRSRRAARRYKSAGAGGDSGRYGERGQGRGGFNSLNNNGLGGPGASMGGHGASASPSPPIPPCDAPRCSLSLHLMLLELEPQKLHDSLLFEQRDEAHKRVILGLVLGRL